MNPYPSAHDGGTVYHTDLLTLCADMARRGLKVDMILCDPPYGQTSCAWDSVIPFEPMWAAFKRIIKPRGAIVLTASQPFTSALVMSNPGMFRYTWVWDKVRPSGFQYANYRPMMQHEDICIFGTDTVNYYPQKVKREKPVRYRGYGKSSSNPIGDRDEIVRWSNEISPLTILAYVEPRSIAEHPTQKPVDLFRYLIRTYTLPGELVFDPCCGSGTTAVAAREEGRRFIVNDSAGEYVAVTRKRLDAPYTPNFMPMLEAAS